MEKNILKTNSKITDIKRLDTNNTTEAGVTGYTGVTGIISDLSDTYDTDDTCIGESSTSISQDSVSPTKNLTKKLVYSVYKNHKKIQDEKKKDDLSRDSPELIISPEISKYKSHSRPIDSVKSIIKITRSPREMAMRSASPLSSPLSSPPMSPSVSPSNSVKETVIKKNRLNSIGLPKLNFSSLLQVPENMTPKAGSVSSGIFMGILNTGDRDRFSNEELKRKYLNFISIMKTRERDRHNKVAIIRVFPDYHEYIFRFLKYSQESNNELAVGFTEDQYIHTEHADSDFIFKREVKYKIGEFSIIVANKAIVKEWKRLIILKLGIKDNDKYRPKMHDDDYAFKILKTEFDIPKSKEDFRKYNLYILSKKIAYDGLIASLNKNRIMPIRIIYDKPEFLTKFSNHECLRSKTYWVISQIFLDKESVRLVKDKKTKKEIAYKVLNSWAVPNGFLRRIVNFVNLYLEDSEFKKIYITPQKTNN